MKSIFIASWHASIKRGSTTNDDDDSKLGLSSHATYEWMYSTVSTFSFRKIAHYVVDWKHRKMQMFQDYVQNTVHLNTGYYNSKK